MTTTSGITGTIPTTTTASSTSGTTATSDQFGQDTFLKLLVAQLKYQDPQNPADATQFLSQTAQFAMVEKLNALASSDTELVRQAQSQTAAALVGKTVSWIDSSTGATVSGKVSGATLGSSPSVTVGGTSVPINSLTGVSTG